MTNQEPPPPLTSLDIENALRERQLFLVYQPIIRIDSGIVDGFEALMRWSHPTRGPISPGIFIPIAEESGLIVALSKWALRESCRALKRIEGRTGRDSNLYMSVNFTPSDFSSDTFIFDLYNIISESDVLPAQIQLEITEELLLSQPETALASLTMCRKAGMKISVDNCAAVQKDLTYLQNYPIDSLKIDRDYIRKMVSDEETAYLVTSIIQAAEQMGKTPIAEGVETADESAALLEAGCTCAQGYLFARPMPEKEVIDFILAAPMRRDPY